MYRPAGVRVRGGRWPRLLVACAVVLLGMTSGARHGRDAGRGPAAAEAAGAMGGSLAAGASAGAGWSHSISADRPRLRELGIEVGRLPPGPLNAITDVKGVRVGQVSIREGDSLRTGVTAVLPHGGNLYREKVPAAVAVGNGFGKLVGVTQVNELGELETPVLLTGTLSVWRAADALVDAMLSVPENRHVTSINPVVGETNDAFLSDIRARPVGPEHVRAALESARSGAVEEGSVGAGTGTDVMGWKGGIGTASRVVETPAGSYTLGVLVQTNYGAGSLRVDGVPVGEELGSRGLVPDEDAGDGEAGVGGAGTGTGSGDRSTAPGGSVMIVLATDAPLAHRELQRVARRSFLGISRTGSYMSHGSGDYAIAFSTDRTSPGIARGGVLSPLFRAAVEATEEAALNSIFRATTVDGFRGTVRALPLEETIRILRAHGRDVPTGRTGEP